MANIKGTFFIEHPSKELQAMMTMIDPAFLCGKLLGSFNDFSFNTKSDVTEEYMTGLCKHLIKQYPFASLVSDNGISMYVIDEAVIAFSDGRQFCSANDLKKLLEHAGYVRVKTDDNVLKKVVQTTLSDEVSTQNA